MLLLFYNRPATAGNLKDNTQMVIHLFDYISRDYAAAVQNGEIINIEEYGELLFIWNKYQPYQINIIKLE